MGNYRSRVRQSVEPRENIDAGEPANPVPPPQIEPGQVTTMEPPEIKQEESEEISPELSTADGSDSSSGRSRTLSGPTTPQKPTKEAIEHLKRELHKISNSNSITEGFRVEPVEDNIFQWRVYLFGFDKETQIKQDLEMYAEVMGRSEVCIEITFPFNYPTSPPFIRVVYPRFHQYTGHITTGGSVCVKDLTKSGWNSKNELLPFIVMIRNLLVEGGALIDMENLSDYTETEAHEAFIRVATAHGWAV